MAAIAKCAPPFPLFAPTEKPRGKKKCPERVSRLPETILKVGM